MRGLVLVLLWIAAPAARAADPTPRAVAFEIARAGLVSNVKEIKDPEDRTHRFLLAGGHQFRALWTRDFAMAVPGALVAGETEAVRSSLDYIFENQAGSGLMPRLIDHTGTAIRVVLSRMGVKLPFEFPLHVEYLSENAVVTIDGNALIPWAASRYLETTGDLISAERWWPIAVKSLALLEQDFFVDGLVGKQPPYADWEDSIARKGKVAFTNEAYLLALRGMVSWARLLGKDESEYQRKSDDFQKRFHDFFWIPEKKMIRNFDGDDHLSADANLMAVVHGLVAPDEAQAIMETLRASPLWSPIPGRATWPEYPGCEKSIYVRLFGMADYHDGLTWLWLGALGAQAERAVENSQGCEDILDRVSEVIVRGGAVEEVYTLKDDVLKPVHRPFYHAERPFSWSSAMFVDAVSRGCGP